MTDTDFHYWFNGNKKKPRCICLAADAIYVLETTPEARLGLLNKLKAKEHPSTLGPTTTIPTKDILSYEFYDQVELTYLADGQSEALIRLPSGASSKSVLQALKDGLPGRFLETKARESFLAASMVPLYALIIPGSMLVLGFFIGDEPLSDAPRVGRAGALKRFFQLLGFRNWMILFGILCGVAVIYWVMCLRKESRTIFVRADRVSRGAG